jgi:Putative DNA-binding domain
MCATFCQARPQRNSCRFRRWNGFNGKEWVAGSSPAEGSKESRANRGAFLLQGGAGDPKRGEGKPEGNPAVPARVAAPGDGCRRRRAVGRLPAAGRGIVSAVRNLALADLTAADLDAMLAENETLFVEHKTSVGGEAFQVAKAMCSFANTLGGWVLIGVTNGAPNAGLPDGWEPVVGADLTDRVREALKENRVDPIPAFAATVRNVGEQPVGVVRVYESADAPHVIRNGQVFVRSVAEDSNRQRVYRPGGVETQTVLIELVERGRRGELRAHDTLEQVRGPFLLSALGFTGRQFGSAFHYELSPGTIALRAAPITGARVERLGCLGASEGRARTRAEPTGGVW